MNLYLSGHRQPNLERLASMASVLGVSLDDLVEIGIRTSPGGKARSG